MVLLEIAFHPVSPENFMTTASTSPSSQSSTKADDVRADLDALKSDFAQIREDLRTMASTAVKEGKSRAYEVRDAAQEKFEDSLDSLESFVKEKPLTACGIAFAAGILASIYMRHR